MSRRTASVPADYFDALYTADPDPWRFRSSDYEQRKYDATLAALSRPRYGDALEVGCAIGVLTRRLAARCDALLAIDGSAVALETAASECAGCPNVRFECRIIPDAFPAGRFDLVVLSEVLYFLTSSDVERAAERCCEALRPDGEIILCHWLGETDYPLSGLRATDLFVDAALRRPLRHSVLSDGIYRLDRLSAA